MNIIPLKRCTRCNQELPATPEYFTKNGHGGLYHHCKSCRKLDRKEDRAVNGDKIRAQRKISDGKRKDKIKVYYAQWSDENKEAIREQKHEYYLEHRDETIERVKQYYQDNKAARKAYIRQWQNENPDKIHIYQKRGYQRKLILGIKPKPLTPEQKERQKAWARAAYATNPNKEKARRHRRRARILASQDGHFTADDVKLQYKSQRGKCWHCGNKVGDDYHIDHLYPLVLGGSNGARNIVVSCEPCNLSKGAKPTWEWNGRLL